MSITASPGTALRSGTACLLALLALPAVAQVYTVGGGPDCTTASLRQAIAAAGQGFEIRIAQDQVYEAQALRITSKKLRLVGGFDTCSDTTPSGQTVLSGAGGSRDSVLTIVGSSEVELDGLALIRGDQVHDGYGGGIDFRGNGRLLLRNTTLGQNYAGYGGGLSARAEGGPLTVTLDRRTIVQLNTAQISGGGIRIAGGTELFMIERDTALLNNEALGFDPVANVVREGRGGGLQVVAPARATLSSPGYGQSGAIAYNTARLGGGIAVTGADIQVHRPA